MGYITNAEMLIFYDARRLRDFLTDDGTGDDLTDGQIGTNTLLEGAIRWASSEIDTKCQNGIRYSRETLEAMVAAAVSGSETEKKRAAVLKKLTADLAYGFLVTRRGQSADQMRELCPAYEDALMRLESLYNGAAVFDLDSALAATVPTRRRLGKLAALQSRTNELFGIFPPDQQYGGLFYAGN